MLKHIIFNTGKKDYDPKAKSSTIKSKILSVLSMHKTGLTSQEIGEKIGLSRNRVSEYMKELWKEGKVTFFLRGKKKYFVVVKNE